MSMLSLLVLRQLRPLPGRTQATASAPEQSWESPSTEQAPRRVEDDDSSSDTETSERDCPAPPMEKTMASIHLNNPSRERSPS